MKEQMTRAATLTLTGVMSALMLTSPRPIFVWNMSASAPVGLYALHRSNQYRHGDLIALTPTQSQADYLSQRGYLDKGALLLKHVAALNGQLACRQDNHILIDGRTRQPGQSLLRPLSHPLSHWSRDALMDG